MQFTVILAAFLAAVPSVMADLHEWGYCFDRVPALNFKVGESTKIRDDITPRACARYKARNTGPNRWDTCPDCHMSTVAGSGTVVCRSDARHIGGDEWAFYCRSEGARGGRASE